MLRARAMAGSLLLAACCSSCLGSCRREVAFNKAGLPLTLKELRGRYAAPEYEISVRRREEDPDGFKCHSGGACVILLPFVALEYLAVKGWDEVTVKRAGETLLEAVYANDGALLSLVQHEAGGVDRGFVRLELPALGEDFVVERSHTELRDGRRVEVAVTTLSQVDLLERYARRLDAEDEQQRGRLLSEVYLALPGEADAFVLDRLSSTKLREEDRVGAVDEVCRSGQNQDPRIAAFVQAAARDSVPAAWSILQCAGLPAPMRAAAARATLPRYCSTSSAGEVKTYLGTWNALPPEEARSGAGTAPSCPAARMTALRATLGHAGSDAEMATAIADPVVGEFILSHLDFEDRLGRRWLLTALAREGTGAMQASLRRRGTFGLDDRPEALLPLFESKAQLDGEESRALLQIMAAQSRSQEGLPAAAGVLLLFHQQGSEPEVLRSLLGVHGELEEAAVLARAALGERAALRALAPKLSLDSSPPQMARNVSTPAGLVGYAMIKGGCRAEELARRLPRGAAAALGACPEP